MWLNWALILFRYDYHLEHLFVQLPTEMHESAATTISDAFTTSVKDLVSHAPTLSRLIKVRTNGDVPYADGGGLYVPDLSIRVIRENVFQVEVAFSQSYTAVRSKIANIR